MLGFELCLILIPQMFNSLVAGVELTESQLTYLIVNACLIIVLGIGLTILKFIRSRDDD